MLQTAVDCGLGVHFGGLCKACSSTCSRVSFLVTTGSGSGPGPTNENVSLSGPAGARVVGEPTGCSRVPAAMGCGKVPAATSCGKMPATSACRAIATSRLALATAAAEVPRGDLGGVLFLSSKLSTGTGGVGGHCGSSSGAGSGVDARRRL